MCSLRPSARSRASRPFSNAWCSALQRRLRVALEHRAGDGEERLAVGDAQHAPHQLLVHLGLARRDHLVERADRVAHRALALVRQQQRRALGEREARALGVGGLARCSSSSRSATLRSGTRAKSKRCVRERMVSGSFCGSVVAKTNTRCGGGSSSVLSSAAKASSESWWTSSMMTTRCLPPVGEKRTFSRSACTSAMPRFEAPSISETSSETPAGDLAARDALVAGLGRAVAVHAAALAVERLGDQPRAGRLADAAGAGEEVGVGDAAALERAREHRGDVLLPDHVGERLRPVLQGKRAMGHGSPHSIRRAAGRSPVRSGQLPAQAGLRRLHD